MRPIVNRETPNKRTRLEPQQLVAIIDTREQLPLDLSPLISIRGTLKTGDYSLQGYEDHICIERKGLSDFIQCCTFQRERFERELERLRVFDYKAIVIEGTWANIELKQYRGTTHPNAVLGSAMAFAMSANVAIIMAESHATAGKLVARLLYVAGNRLLRSAKPQAKDSPSLQPKPSEGQQTCKTLPRAECPSRPSVQSEHAPIAALSPIPA